MIWQTITVVTDYGHHQLRSFPTATPGIVVVEPVPAEDHPGWSVIHQRSGFSLGYVADPETAQAVALLIASLSDWTMSGEDMCNDETLRDAVDAVFDEFDGWHGECDPVTPRSDRNPL